MTHPPSMALLMVNREVVTECGGSMPLYVALPTSLTLP